jgi:hypothetical protein
MAGALEPGKRLAGTDMFGGLMTLPGLTLLRRVRR